MVQCSTMSDHPNSSSNNTESSGSSPSRQVTVVDVYDLASAIGKDFEKLIEQFGADVVTEMMPKVISSLEMLEAFASRNERENEEIIGLQQNVQRLEVDKKEKMDSREKFEHELVQIEENYRSEIQDLWEMVQKLQEENKRLSTKTQQIQSPGSAPLTLTENDWHVMLKLKENVEKQREQIKSMERENDERNNELEAVQQQLDRVNRINKELIRKNHAIQNQGRFLVEEKAELISQIQSRDKLIEELQHRLGQSERSLKDLAQTKVNDTENDVTESDDVTAEPAPDIKVTEMEDPPVAPDEQTEEVVTSEPSTDQVITAPALSARDPRSVMISIGHLISGRTTFATFGMNPTELEAKCSPEPEKTPELTAEEQLKKEQDDSDRENTPRFTLRELREVLQEKNTLKARVMELEEELEQLRPKPPTPRTPETEEEEILVYGPINREPDDKLNPWTYSRKDSGVRKLFSKLWYGRGKKSTAPTSDQGGSSGTNRLSNSPIELAQSASQCNSERSSRDSTIMMRPYPVVHEADDEHHLVMEDCSLLVGQQQPASFDSSLVTAVATALYPSVRSSQPCHPTDTKLTTMTYDVGGVGRDVEFNGDSIDCCIDNELGVDFPPIRPVDEVGSYPQYLEDPFDCVSDPLDPNPESFLAERRRSFFHQKSANGTVVDRCRSMDDQGYGSDDRPGEHQRASISAAGSSYFDHSEIEGSSSDGGGSDSRIFVRGRRDNADGASGGSLQRRLSLRVKTGMGKIMNKVGDLGEKVFDAIDSTGRSMYAYDEGLSGDGGY